ncbi:MAG: CNNM domain-containing protein [Flavobacteriaceae bacterium]|nr:CNNM domain-containing protein [Flavobacteriaceae bacterium]
MSIIIIFFVVSILVSFICSLIEAVLLSITPSYSKKLAREGSASGAYFEEIKKDIDKPLSAILTLNTIAHTVGAIGVGAQAGKLWGNHFFNVLGIQISYESIVATFMTLAILILSEIIPKTIGANNWKSLIGFTAKTLKIMIFILSPFVWISQLITRSLKKNKDESVLSRSDFKAMAESVEESGELQKSEYKIIKNLLGFEELNALDIMTPRTVIAMADENMTIQDYYKMVNRKMPYSRIPLFDHAPDNITGVLLKDDLLQQLVDGAGHKKLKDIKRNIVAVNESLSLPHLFELLVQKNNHISMVVDEYGMVQGLVTMEDLIETLFGREITDETDNITDLQQYAREQWQKRSQNLGIDLNN